MGIDSVRGAPVMVGMGAQAKEIKGRSGIFFSKDEIKLRKFDQQVELKTVRDALKNNDLDEIVFRTNAGERFVLYADELVGDMKVGDPISVAGYEGTVELVDDEWNEDRVTASLIAGGLLVGGVAGATVFAVGATSTGAAAFLAQGVQIGAAAAGGVGGAGLGWVAGKVAPFRAAEAGDAKIQANSEEVRGWGPK